MEQKTQNKMSTWVMDEHVVAGSSQTLRFMVLRTGTYTYNIGCRLQNLAFRVSGC